MKLKLKVIPGSSKDCIMGWLDDALKIKIKAPPENGKANAALEKFLAKSLGISVKRVEIISGFTNAKKLVDIKGMDEESFFAKVPPPVNTTKA